MSALIQNTEEWLEYRKNKIGASDAPIIMEVSPWTTPYQLWCSKLSITPAKEQSFAMERGQRLEPQARLMFSLENGIEVEPQVLIHPSNEWMIASLDGITSDKKIAVEIKTAGQEDHKLALCGKIPDKYFPQLQHQLEVSELDSMFYYSFDGHDGVTLKLNRDDKYIKKMVSKEKEFWDCMQDFIAPDMSEKDYEKRNDDVWKEIASNWILFDSQEKEILKKLKEIKSQKDSYREHLITMAKDKNTIGGNVKVSKYPRRSPIDYESIPELKDVNLELYRPKAIEIWRIVST